MAFTTLSIRMVVGGLMATAAVHGAVVGDNKMLPVGAVVAV